MSAAGLRDVATDRWDIRLHLGPPADFLWQYLLGTPLAEPVAELDAGGRARLERAVVERWEPFVTGGETATEVGLVLGTAAAA